MSRADRLDLLLQLAQQRVGRAELGPKVITARRAATAAATSISLLLPIRLLLCIRVAVVVVTALLRLSRILLLLRVRVAAARLGDHAVRGRIRRLGSRLIPVVSHDNKCGLTHSCGSASQLCPPVSKARMRN